MSGVGKRRGEGRERERGERTYLLSSNIFEDWEKTFKVSKDSYIAPEKQRMSHY